MVDAYNMYEELDSRLDKLNDDLNDVLTQLKDTEAKVDEAICKYREICHRVEFMETKMVTFEKSLSVDEKVDKLLKDIDKLLEK